jgi:nicotinic acid phosphoribosyltransferase
MEDFNKDSKIYKDELDRYNDLYNNAHNHELYKSKMEMIYELHKNIKVLLTEYANTGDHNILNIAVVTHKNDLMTEIENLRRLKYDIMEVNIEPNANSPDISTLFQSEVAMSRCEYLYGESPSVVKFSM